MLLITRLNGFVDGCFLRGTTKGSAEWIAGRAWHSEKIEFERLCTFLTLINRYVCYSQLVSGFPLYLHCVSCMVKTDEVGFWDTGHWRTACSSFYYLRTGNGIDRKMWSLDCPLNGFVGGAESGWNSGLELCPLIVFNFYGEGCWLPNLWWS